MTAIETSYKGYRFRSRLEARWAVFFDALGIRWEYEPEGYKVGRKGYLPDFLINREKYIEVKPTHPTDEEKEKAQAVGATIVIGLPNERNAWPSVDDLPWNGNAETAYRKATEARFEHGETPTTIVDDILYDIQMGKLPDLEINQEMDKALLLAENTSQNLLIVGGAGTGKSTFIDLFRKYSKKRVQVAAFTGTAAMNVSGRTLHRTFGLPVSSNYTSVDAETRLTNEEIEYLRNVQTFVIDEVSMVRIDVMAAIDATLVFVRGNRKPFGGAQMIFIGDPYQLQPILKKPIDRHLKEYFEDQGFRLRYYKFFSRLTNGISYMDSAHMIEFSKVYRQISDVKFTEVLNRFRTFSREPLDLDYINSRVLPPPEGVIHLVSKNAQAKEINDRCFSELQKNGDAYLIKGEESIIEDPINEYPTKQKDIHIIEGMRVVIVMNSSHTSTDVYVIGTQGVIQEIEWLNGSVEAVHVRIGGGAVVRIKKTTWSFKKNVYDKDAMESSLVETAKFTQFPLIPGYASTIHKSQGQTYQDGVYLDPEGLFAFGQAYVALSRVTSHNKLYLKSPIQPKQIINKRNNEMSQLLQIQAFLDYKKEQRNNE